MGKQLANLQTDLLAHGLTPSQNLRQEAQQKMMERKKDHLEHNGVSPVENGEGTSKREVNGEAMSETELKGDKASFKQKRREHKEKQNTEMACTDSLRGEKKKRIKKRKWPVLSEVLQGSLSESISTEAKNSERRNFLDTGSDKKQTKKKKTKIKERNGSISSDLGEFELQNNGIVEVRGIHQGSKRDDANSRKDRPDEDSQVNVSGRGCHERKYQPCKSFEDLNVPQHVLECCRSFQNPSPIQAHAWPFLLGGRDLIGIAATGSVSIGNLGIPTETLQPLLPFVFDCTSTKSGNRCGKHGKQQLHSRLFVHIFMPHLWPSFDGGKTLAFGVPALAHAIEKRSNTYKQNFPVCLVLSPTRELAQQIAVVLEDAGSSCGVGTVCLYGGSSKKPQVAALKSGVAIIVATPGRLQDLLEEGACHINNVSFLVLDEADRMLDLGFEPAVRGIVRQTSKSRQTIMFSATWPPAVDQLSKEFMQDPDPIKVVVGSQDLAANHDVTQIVEVLEENARDSRLMALLQQYHQSARNRVLVFVLYKKEAVRVENFVRKRGWNVTAVHGDKGQYDRNKAVASFKDGTCPLLIATDVAARGLDIPDVEYVINYSFPLTTEDYVHRIGRTGRAGKSGVAHTFFTHVDKPRAGELVNVLREAGQAVPSELLRFGTHVKKKESKLYGAHFKEVPADAPKATKITFDSDDE